MTVDVPARRTPVDRVRSPGRTTTTVPGSTWAAGTHETRGRPTRRARGGVRSASSAATSRRARVTLHDSRRFATANRLATVAPSDHSPSAAAPTIDTTTSTCMSRRRPRMLRHTFGRMASTPDIAARTNRAATCAGISSDPPCSTSRPTRLRAAIAWAARAATRSAPLARPNDLGHRPRSRCSTSSCHGSAFMPGRPRRRARRPRTRGRVEVDVHPLGDEVEPEVLHARHGLERVPERADFLGAMQAVHAVDEALSHGVAGLRRGQASVQRGPTSWQTGARVLERAPRVDRAPSGRQPSDEKGETPNRPARLGKEARMPASPISARRTPLVVIAVAIALGAFVTARAQRLCRIPCGPRSRSTSTASRCATASSSSRRLRAEGHSRTYPIMLNRTPYSVAPYGADNYTRQTCGPSPTGFVRGRATSSSTRTCAAAHVGGRVRRRAPARPARSRPADIDESTDTWDTIDWLVKNVPTTTARSARGASRIPASTPRRAMIDAHPALKAVSPQAPVTDWFMGDDFHHNGAFFLADASTSIASFGKPRPKPTHEERAGLRPRRRRRLRLLPAMGPLANANTKYFKDGIAFWNELMAHPTYDEFWQARNLAAAPEEHQARGDDRRRLVRRRGLYGALETYRRSRSRARAPRTSSSWARGATAAGRATTATRSATSSSARRPSRLLPRARSSCRSSGIT